MMVVGGIIGSGIFLNPAIVAARVGSTGLTLLVWILGGVVALIGALVYAELGAWRPVAGGGYVYLRDGYGPLPAFLYAWTLLLVIATGAIAAVAVTFANYAAALLGWNAGARVPLAVAAIITLSAVNYVGVRPGALTQNVLTVLKLAALVLLIVAGLTAAAASGRRRAGTATAAEYRTDVGSSAGSGVVRLWRLATNQLHCRRADRARTESAAGPHRRREHRGRSVPDGEPGLSQNARHRRSGAEQRAGSRRHDCKVRLGGGTIIAAGIAISSFGFLNLVILVSPRVYRTMAQDGLFFPSLARLHPKYRTPAAAIVFQGVWAILLTLTGHYGDLLDYVVFGDWIFFGSTAATLFVFRARARRSMEPKEIRFRMPGYPAAPLIFILAAAYVVVGSIASNPGNAVKGATLIALGIPVYLFGRGRPGRGGDLFSRFLDHRGTPPDTSG